MANPGMTSFFPSLMTSEMRGRSFGGATRQQSTCMQPTYILQTKYTTTTGNTTAKSKASRRNKPQPIGASKGTTYPFPWLGLLTYFN